MIAISKLKNKISITGEIILFYFIKVCNLLFPFCTKISMSLINRDAMNIDCIKMHKTIHMK